jgi:hypothetical protein
MKTNMETTIMADWVREFLDPPPQAANFNAANGGEPERPEKLTAVRQALNLRREVERFERHWPSPAADETLIPPITWGQLERQIADLADTPIKVAMARDLVSATRKMARFKPPEMVLREILCLTWALLDEGFQPEFGPEQWERPEDMP